MKLNYTVRVTMAKGKRQGVAPLYGRTAIILACRLTQIEKNYPSFAAFANAVGVSTSTLHYLKTGNSNVTIETIEKISSKLGMPVCTLLGVDEADYTKSLKRLGIDINIIDSFLLNTNNTDNEVGIISLKEKFDLVKKTRAGRSGRPAR